LSIEILTGAAAHNPPEPKFSSIPNSAAAARRDPVAIRAAIAPFERVAARDSVRQLAITIALFAATCAAMYGTLAVSYLLTLALAVPAAGLLVRLFIFQHDCGHGSYFASRRANTVVGILCSVFTLTPYANWRRQHARHHGNWNNLDRRAAGVDIYGACLTVKEYRALSFWHRALYRHLRNPILTYVVLPPLVFTMLYRVPFDTPSGWRRERHAVYWTNALLVAAFGALGFWLGFKAVLMVQAPVIVMGSIVGVWLFAVQHRFDGAQWTRQARWNPADASLDSTSYLKLPAILQWFTGNIGFHHVHHLSQRVPNYRLAACHAAVPALHGVGTLSLWAALKSVRLVLWDEDRQRLIGFGELAAA
jgi:omega-6 fatty acid desaturase (delta-12 desaturase)